MDEREQIDIILEFLKIAREGIKKPHDPSQVIAKIQRFEDNYNRGRDEDESINLDHIKNCCTDIGTVCDANDFRPYILASLRRYSEILELEIR